MPLLSEPGQQPISVAPSAPFELMWVAHFAEARHEHGGEFSSLEPVRQRIGPELTRLRGDGTPRYSTEIVVLAHRSGTLLDLDLDRFFAGIDDAIADASPLPSLRSESAEELEVVRTRLQRLQADPEHRKRFVAVLQALWDAVKGEWESQGRPAAVAEAERWRRALAEGTPFRRLLEASRLWPSRPGVEEISDAAAARGDLVLNPCWFGGKIHILELDEAMYLGRGFRHTDVAYRKVAADISANIKALSDPTRLAILLRLARDPASVTEVAKQFQLSQPTVSSHVQVLREAGLIEERTVGRSAMLSASEEGLRRMFSEAEESLLRMFRG